MKFLLPLAVLLAGVPAAAQLRWFEPLVQLKQFLQLTDSQLQTILMNNDEYNRWSSEKQNRIFQVQTGIFEETVKSLLDANAIGVRYVEIETICREMTEHANLVRARNLDVLNQDQKAS